MKENIKIGIDFHGVITANPEFFKQFNQAALDRGNEIFVLSGGHYNDILKYLDEKQIPFSRIWSMLDYYDSQCLVTYLEDGSFKVDDTLWNTAKASYCLEQKIDFHIDDSILYGEHFKTPYCLYDIQQKKCSSAQDQEVIIDFNQKPQEVLDKIMEAVRVMRQPNIP